MKPREDRRKVMIKARMRTGTVWSDVCILNLSLNGIGLQAAETPVRGTYVEIRRGSQVIIARVAWSNGHRAGLRSQNPIVMRDIVGEAARDAHSNSLAIGGIERRRTPRAQQSLERSRLLGRAMEFACFAFAAIVMAVLAFGAVEQALANPLSRISAALV